MLQTVEISLPELLERVRAGKIPLSAKAQVTYDDAALPTPQEDAAEDAPNPTLALFEQWDKEDAAMSAEELEEDRRIFAEIEKNGIPRVRI